MSLARSKYPRSSTIFPSRTWHTSHPSSRTGTRRPSGVTALPCAVQDVFADDGRLCDPTAPAGLARPAIGAAVRQALERIPEVAFALESVETEDGRAAFECCGRSRRR